MPRQSAASRIALVCAVALAAAVAGCSNKAQVLQDQNDGGWFSKPLDVFAKPDWARPTADTKTYDLGPKGPVGPDDLVGADGRCAIAAPETAQAAAPPVAAASEPPADRPVGSVAGDLAGPPMPAAPLAVANPAAGLQGGPPPGGPQVMGGIALGMTECQAVQRAGSPGNITMGAGEKGERTVTLTYLTGTWPGIYRFADGRLREIERVAAPPEPAKKTAKNPVKKPVKKPNTASVQ